MYSKYIVNLSNIYCSARQVRIVVFHDAVIAKRNQTCIYVDRAVCLFLGSHGSSFQKRACSSMVEHRCNTAEAGGSIPTRAHQGLR